MTKQEFLAMSLPYGLKCQYEDIIVFERELINIGNVKFIHLTNCKYDNKIGFLQQVRIFKKYWIARCEIKHKHLEAFYNGKGLYPILRPLSDLTKEIEHKGEKFVPIVRLIEIAFGGEEIDTNRVKLSFEDDMYIAKINELEFGFDITDNSFVSYLDRVASCVPNQLLLFQKLIEWHFDLFDGIKNEEAIDVNTLEENPYK